MLEHGIESPVADWPTKRRWASEAIDRLQAAGITSPAETNWS